jgi:hypothetical protein
VFAEHITYYEEEFGDIFLYAIDRWNNPRSCSDRPIRQTEGSPKAEHRSELCEACALGVCSRQNREEDSNYDDSDNDDSDSDVVVREYSKYTPPKYNPPILELPKNTLAVEPPKQVTAAIPPPSYDPPPPSMNCTETNFCIII